MPPPPPPSPHPPSTPRNHAAAYMSEIHLNIFISLSCATRLKGTPVEIQDRHGFILAILPLLLCISLIGHRNLEWRIYHSMLYTYNVNAVQFERIVNIYIILPWGVWCQSCAALAVTGPQGAYPSPALPAFQNPELLMVR
jgi:hypothetical protein